MSHTMTTQQGDALIPAVSAGQHQDSTEPPTTLLTKPLQLASTATLAYTSHRSDSHTPLLKKSLTSM